MPLHSCCLRSRAAVADMVPPLPLVIPAQPASRQAPG